MLVIIGSIITEVVAGLIVWALTEGRSSGGSTQIINIQNAYFVDGVREISPSSSSSSSSNDGENFLGIAIGIAIAVIILVAGIATIYVNFIDAILTIGYWVAILAIIFSLGLLVAGYFYQKKYQDISAMLLALFCFFMSLAFSGLVWLIYSPLSPPQDYVNTFLLLQEIEVGVEGWWIKAFNVGISHWDATQFLFWQSIGILPALISIAIVIYIEIRLFFIIKDRETTSFQTWAMFSAPSLAFAASICLGLFAQG